MIIQDRKQRIAYALIKQYDAVESAQRRLNEARAEQKKAWDAVLEHEHKTYGSMEKWPLPETVFVLSYDCIYEIKFCDNWALPEIKRIDDYAEVINLSDWS